MSSHTPSTPHSTSPHSGSASSGKPLPFIIQLSRPYLSAQQIRQLEHDTTAASSSSSTASTLQAKFSAFQLILNLGEYVRFPIRTMGTAMIIFQRFYLFNSIQDFPSTLDTAHACLFVACKMEDTLKKLKDIVVASYYLKYPNSNDLNLDSPVLEEQRRRLIALERHVLETMSFDFRIRHPQPYIIKFCKFLNLPSDMGKTAWLVCIDSYKTLAPLKNTPAAVALACVYVACALNQSDDANNSGLDVHPARFNIPNEQFESVILDLLEFYIDWLPQAILYQKYKDPGLFMEIRIEFNKRLSLTSSTSPPSSVSHRYYQPHHESNNSNHNYGRHRVQHDADLILRDLTAGDKGTVRFVIDADRERVEREWFH
ncbi:cyclin-like protein [Lipomyces japonicus]|uniref:cyclin-like protein n=1 Tax=Lipomyces japonicus TaxID=56871 RepID=UPI0034CE358F